MVCVRKPSPIVEGHSHSLGVRDIVTTVAKLTVLSKPRIFESLRGTYTDLKSNKFNKILIMIYWKKGNNKGCTKLRRDEGSEGRISPPHLNGQWPPYIYQPLNNFCHLWQTSRLQIHLVKSNSQFFLSIVSHLRQNLVSETLRHMSWPRTRMSSTSYIHIAHSFVASARFLFAIQEADYHHDSKPSGVFHLKKIRRREAHSS